MPTVRTRITSDSLRRLAVELASDTVERRHGGTADGKIGMIEPWSSLDVAAKHLRFVKGRTSRWIERRGLPAHKMGRFWTAAMKAPGAS